MGQGFNTDVKTLSTTIEKVNILNDIDYKRRKLVTLHTLLKRYLMSSATKFEVMKCNHLFEVSNATLLFSSSDAEKDGAVIKLFGNE